mmetsp:Transcript_38888/g.59091  ORF Transcript_38888/g.59091 Transcript_38888/m.59091 type:complete len:943 (+) Transcript_38888:2673-5501(+)
MVVAGSGSAHVDVGLGVSEVDVAHGEGLDVAGVHGQGQREGLLIVGVLQVGDSVAVVGSNASEVGLLEVFSIGEDNLEDVGSVALGSSLVENPLLDGVSAHLEVVEFVLAVVKSGQALAVVEEEVSLGVSVVVSVNNHSDGNVSEVLGKHEVAILEDSDGSGHEMRSNLVVLVGVIGFQCHPFSVGTIAFLVIIGAVHVNDIAVVVNVDPAASGEVGLMGLATGLEDRSDLEGITHDELVLNLLVDAVVVGVVEDKRVEASASVLVHVEQTRVQVAHESQSFLDGSLGPSLVDLVEKVGLGTVSASASVFVGLVSVLSSEGIVGRELEPSSAKLLVLVLDLGGAGLEEAADIRADHGDAKHVEVHHSGDGVVHVGPLSVVVTEPMSGVLAGAGESASAEDERSLVLENGRLFGHPLASLLSLDQAEKGVGVVLAVAGLGVSGIQGHGHVVEVELSRHEGKVVSAFVILRVALIPVATILKNLRLEERDSELSLGLFLGGLGSAVGALSIAESSDLVHVEPESIEGNLIEEVNKSSLPDFNGLVVQEIKENSVLGPHNGTEGISEVGRGIGDGRLNQGLGLASVVEVLVSLGALVGIGRNTGVDDDDHLLAIGLDAFSVGLEVLPISVVNGEVGVSIHVGDIEPDALERDASIGVALLVGLHIGESLVAIGGGVPSEGPKRREARKSNKGLVLLDDINGGTLEEEVDLDLATSGDVAEGGGAIVVVLDHGRLSIGVSEVHTGEVALLSSLEEEEGVHSVGLEATGSVIIRSLLSVGPHGPGTFGQLELSVSLTETVESLGGNLEVHLHVLVHEEERLSLGGNVELAIRSAGVLELDAEGRLVHAEAAHIRAHRSLGVSSSDVLLGRSPAGVLVIGKSELGKGVINLADLEADLVNDLVVLTNVDGGRIHEVNLGSVITEKLNLVLLKEGLALGHLLLDIGVGV